MTMNFGEFVLVSDVRCYLDQKIPNGPWIHLGTCIRGFKQYMAFKSQQTQKVYIEELDEKEPGVQMFKQIVDDILFQEVYEFFLTRGVLLQVSTQHEISVGKHGLLG